MERRKILCISPDKHPAVEAGLLKLGTWDVLQASDLATATRIQARQEVQVGLFLLDDLLPEKISLADACVRKSRCMEWVVVFHKEAVELPALRELVLHDFFDYHTLPVDWPVLNLTLGHAFRRAQLRGGGKPLPVAVGDMGMVGVSAPISNLREQIRRVAVSDAPVLIGGESGSGKELAARAVHESSRRADGPFVAVNCGGIAPSLIHSELFGHERGSFSGATSAKQGFIEAASGGTIFLDEVGDLPIELQTNLLRFLQERTIHRVGSTRSLQIDTRVLAASHMNLAEAVAAGRFREDLFYRLNVLPLVVPPLRERRSDVPILAKHFLQVCMADPSQRRAAGFSRQSVAAMMAHDWPGNVRELYNRVQRARVMTDQRLITPADLLLTAPAGKVSVGLNAIRTMAERDEIALTLGRVGRNVTHAARELGISRMTLYRLIDKHGLLSHAERSA